VRYLLASVPYRKALNFTFDGLKSAATSIERLRNYKLRLETAKFSEGAADITEPLARTAQALKDFEESMDDDLNTAQALAAVFEYVRETNTAMDAGVFPAAAVKPALELLERFDSVFEVLEPTRRQDALTDQEIDASIAQRAQAKKSRDFAGADRIRRELLEQGVILEDTKDGVRWKRK
jgi:cysteinyl-tRNA synthetase